VTRVRADPSRYAALVDEVAAAHAGRTSRWLVRPHPGHERLTEALAAAGYAPADRAVATSIATSSAASTAAGGPAVRAVATLRDLDDWWDVIEGAFERSADRTDPERRLRECTEPCARVHRFVAYDETTGAPVSAGGVTLFPALQFCLLWAGSTIREARGRGAYSAVLTARLAWAREAGIERAGLFALVDTSAPIVARYGFDAHETVTYWERGSTR
ncbi:MAG: hypothetical protein WCJ30_28125, partial [Deltaproteobacteria bacterium]